MDTNLKTSTSEKVAKLGSIYAENGFFSPVDALSKGQAETLRKDYEAAEEEREEEEHGGVLSRRSAQPGKATRPGRCPA